MSGSVAFDRAADYYDETRAMSEEGIRATTRALAGTLDGTAPVLEVGVGTGQVALPLHEAGADLVGIDLARPMMRRLLDKRGGVPPFPLVEGDATRMPFADGAFAGAYLRHVLHLIPDWPTAVTEIVRVVTPAGVFVAGLGSYGGIRARIQARFADEAGISLAPVGLDWDGWDLLDDVMGGLGAAKLPDVTFEDQDDEGLESFVRGMEQDRYSWTWSVADPATRARAAAAARRWAEERWGPLDRVPRETFAWRLARYRLG